MHVNMKTDNTVSYNFMQNDMFYIILHIYNCKNGVRT